MLRRVVLEGRLVLVHLLQTKRMVLKTAPSNAVTLRISPLGLSAALCTLTA